MSIVPKEQPKGQKDGSKKPDRSPAMVFIATCAIGLSFYVAKLSPNSLNFAVPLVFAGIYVRVISAESITSTFARYLAAHHKAMSELASSSQLALGDGSENEHDETLEPKKS